MRNIRWKRISSIFAWTIYGSALLAPNLFLCHVNRYDVSSIQKLALASLVLVGWHLAFRRTARAVFFMFPIFLLIPFDLFFTITYQEPPTTAVVSILASTNIHETMDYLNGRELLLGCAISLSMAIWFYAYRAATPLPIDTKLAEAARWLGRAVTASWMMALAWAAVPHGSLDDYLVTRADAGLVTNDARVGELPLQLERLGGIFPVGRLFSIASYVVAEQRAAVLNRRLRDFSFGAEAGPPAGERQVYVLVIGEASRPDRWQINGYARATNPLLAAQPNLVPLTDVVSPWTWTNASVPVIVSRKPGTVRSRLFAERSLLWLFHEAGFRTYWISNQARQTGASPVGQPASEADEQWWMNVSANDVFGESTFDEVLLPKFREILARPERRQLIVLHLLGSHDAYNKRYPDKFNRWKPSLTDHPDADYHDFRIRDEINNSYDNSILYTDYIISSVIDTLRANESLLSGLFYIADHGENIFDERCPLTGHGGTAYFGYPVSALAWISDRYAKAFTEAVQNLRAHAHSRLTTENIFDSLGDLAHLSYRGMDRSRSILSAEFRARPRMVNVGTEIVDWDHARFISECRKPAPIGITLAK